MKTEIAQICRIVINARKALATGQDIDDMDISYVSEISFSFLSNRNLEPVKGTGSEVTAFSVITDHSRNYKLTVGSEYLLPKTAILDPKLITTVPAKTAAACGVDAMVHALEAYISLAASPFSDMMALKALQLIGGSLRKYYKNRTDEESAEEMLLGSLFAGIAFSPWPMLFCFQRWWNIMKRQIRESTMKYIVL